MRQSAIIRGHFSVNFTTDENRKHFALADAMSIDASASWMVRRLLRMRNRYEFHNNSYYAGMADTIANYVIGTGPQLQMQIPGQKALNREIEKRYSEWAEEVDVASKMFTSDVSPFTAAERLQYALADQSRIDQH